MSRLSAWHPFNLSNQSEKWPVAVKGEGSHIILEDGRRILDMTCSWWVTLHGHGIAEIAEAIARQAREMEQVIFANFVHPPALELMDELSAIVPEHLTKSFFSDNGSTAVEVALKMAYQYWQNVGQPTRQRYIAFEGAYHGDTLGAMSVGGPSPYNAVFRDLLFNVDYIAYPQGDQESENASLASLEKLLTEKDGLHAALIIEPLVQGAGGMRFCSRNFLQKLEELLRPFGVLCIYDEVFTGFGRTGKFFAAEAAGTKPDILCLSKGITGGFLPLAVTLCQEKIYAAFRGQDRSKSFLHGHSYTGNPIACAAAVSSLRLLKEKREVVSGMESRQRKFAQALPVENIRHLGSITAFEVLGESANYLNPVGKEIQIRCFEKGLHIRPLGNTVYVLPPYCVSDAELEETYNVLDSVLKGLE